MILLNPSLGFISEIGSEKGHCADAPPPSPPLSSLPHPPLICTLLPFHSCLPPLTLSLSLSFHSVRHRGLALTHHLLLCSLALSLPSLAIAQNKFAMKMGKNDHHGPARETQGESDIIPPSLAPLSTPPHSHLGWRQWDACATNHLYTLISASGL